MSKSKWLLMSNLSESPHSKLIARVASLVVLASTYATYTLFIKSNTASLEQSAANWNLATMVIVLFSAFILSAALGEVYWVRFNVKLDERQREMRRKIYEKSYIALAIIILIGIILMPYVISKLTLVGKGHSLELPIVQISFYIYALPSVIAAWHKDS